MSDAKRTRRPLPKPDIYMETRPFWEAAREKKLLLQCCRDTGKYQWQPRPVSIYTGSRNLEWREASGRGTLYAWTNTLSAWPGHEDRVPYLCAIIELEEGTRIVTNLVNCDPETLKAGMPVQLGWEKLSDEFNFPVFEPAEAA